MSSCWYLHAGKENLKLPRQNYSGNTEYKYEHEKAQPGRRTKESITHWYLSHKKIEMDWNWIFSSEDPTVYYSGHKN